MSTDKEGMVNGSSITTRVSSNFAPARTAPGVHSTPSRRFYFLEIDKWRLKCPPGATRDYRTHRATLGLKEAFRGLGLGGFHPDPGTWIVREDLSVVQIKLYRGGVQNLPPP